MGSNFWINFLGLNCLNKKYFHQIVLITSFGSKGLDQISGYQNFLDQIVSINLFGSKCLIIFVATL